MSLLEVHSSLGCKCKVMKVHTVTDVGFGVHWDRERREESSKRGNKTNLYMNLGEKGNWGR